MCTATKHTAGQFAGLQSLRRPYMRARHGLIFTFFISLSLFACAEEQRTPLGAQHAAGGGGASSAGGAKADGTRPIAIFLPSHGDVDDFEEIEPYIRSAFLKNVGVPLPKTLRQLLQDPAYWLSRKMIEEQYAVIGPTRYRENAQLQMEALQRELDRRGVPARVYIGYNFMPSFIEETAAQMRADGVREIVVFNKGAQYSLATLGESIDELEHYLDENPEWEVKVTAVRQFSDDPRFIDLFEETLRRDVETHFAEIPPADVCILIASHGLPLRLIKMGDPAVDQMRATFAEREDRMAEFPLYHGFLNDDFFPGAEWVSPSAPDVAHEMRSVSCPAVLMDARLSFTTHHRATLYDLDVDAREILEEPDTLSDGITPHPLWSPAKVVLAEQWDDDEGFARLIADLSEEALRGEGDLIKVR